MPSLKERMFFEKRRRKALRVDRRWLPAEEKFRVQVREADYQSSRGKPENAYKIFLALKLLTSARKAKDVAMKNAEMHAKAGRFAAAEKIYKTLGESRAAMITGKKQVAAKEAVREMTLGKLSLAEKYIAELAKLGEYGFAAELYEDLARKAEEKGGKEKGKKLREAAASLRERTKELEFKIT